MGSTSADTVKQHFGVLELYKWFATTLRFLAPNSVARFFFVSITTLGLRRFGGRANSRASTHHKRIVPGHVWIPHRNSGRINTPKIARIFETNRMGLVPGPGSK